jgi:hypothetical protein
MKSAAIGRLIGVYDDERFVAKPESFLVVMIGVNESLNESCGKGGVKDVVRHCTYYCTPSGILSTVLVRTINLLVLWVQYIMY